MNMLDWYILVGDIYDHCCWRYSMGNERLISYRPQKKFQSVIPIMVPFIIHKFPANLFDNAEASQSAALPE